MSKPQNNTLGLAPLQVQKQNVGSATGNPRNKCALKPGHSLMDWIRLGNSGSDLSGTKGAIVPVSSKELSKHCSQDDAWMAIRGNVYNVTRYMDFHPGGPAELMRGVGKDATKLFDEVHAWVNYEQLLKKCLIGPLQNVVKIDADFFKPPTIDVSPPKFIIPLDKTPPKTQPRFDWIQKLSDVTLYFYTKEFSNPGLVLKRNNLKNIDVRICIENCWYQYTLELHDEITWPPMNTNISSESGKIEIHFTKTKTKIWPSFGTYNKSNNQQLEDTYYESEILQKQNFNKNSYALLLRLKNDIIILPSVGYHVSFSCNIDGNEVNRSYTPVPKKYSPISCENLKDLHFLIKTYEDGLLSNYVKNLTNNSSLVLSQPRGSLLLSSFLGHTNIALFAAGSGITPMLSIIDHLLARKKQRIEKLILWYFNKSEQDIWCKEILKEVMESDDRLKISYVCSQSQGKINEEDGHISRDLMKNIKNPLSETYSTFICTCGPPAFNALTESILKTLNFPSTDMHFFNS